jgi:dUTP pyrophosphatase
MQTAAAQQENKMPSPEEMRSMIPKAPVRVINKSKHPLPQYETSGASGMDVKANLETDKMMISSGETALVPTGLFVEIPPGLEIQVRPRSGMSLKTKMRVCNSPGTIDSCYRGEVKVIMENTGVEPFAINDGDRIAQLVLCPVIQVQWQETETLSETDRGVGGFGSTGK